jgi:hypothetical protein
MHIAGESVGRHGAVALTLAAAAAALLAVHGYGYPGSLGHIGAGVISGGRPTPRATTSDASPRATPTSAAPTSASPHGTATAGPLLSTTQYAGYTYQLYPGTPYGSARQALAGFTFSAHRTAASVTFTLTVSGGSQPPVTKSYSASDHIYFVEANLGDDSANSDYNFGDDGVVVTDASGHVVQ